jgi:predicted neutral ceramidase superfamily lipid hydrolase
MGENDMGAKKNNPKPSGISLALVAGFLVVGMPFVTTYLGLRYFEVDPRVSRWQVIMNLTLFIFLVLPIILVVLFAIRRRCLNPLLRSILVIAPALVLTMPGLIESMVSPAKPDVSFTERMRCPCPGSA